MSWRKKIFLKVYKNCFFICLHLRINRIILRSCRYLSSKQTLDLTIHLRQTLIYKAQISIESKNVC